MCPNCPGGVFSIPGDILAIGDCAEAMVLQINEETSRVALSFKRLQANPWEVVATCLHSRR